MLSPPFLAMAPNYFCNESGHENFQNLQDWQDFANVIDKGKSLSEALLFAWEEHIVYRNCSDCQKQFLYTTCSPHVLSLEFSSCKSVNNLSSYCGLVDAKIRASDKDLPALIGPIVAGAFVLIFKVNSYNF